MRQSAKILDSYLFLMLVSSMHVQSLKVINYTRLRIIGSFECAYEQYPYQVSLQHNNTHFCGGSLMATFWVLTAAHCCTQHEIADSRAVTGLYPLRGLSASQTASVVAWYIHPKYNHRPMRNDICLLKLGTPIYETKSINYVKLADENNWSFRESGCQSAVVLGFGPAKLKCVNLPIANDDDCYIKYRVDESLFCTLNSTAEGACQGDPGSPFLCNMVQYGVVSYGCDLKNYSVYARVDIHLQFLAKIIRENTSWRSVPISFFHIIWIYMAILMFNHITY